MNVFEKSKLHADRRELGTKKTTTLHYLILKLCSVLSISNHATVTKIKITFIREFMGTQLKVLNILSSPNHIDALYCTSSPPSSCPYYQAETPTIPQLFPRPV